MDTAVSLSRDGRTNRVDNTHGQGTSVNAVLESQERVSSLTGLGDKDADVVSEDGRSSIKEVRSKLDRHGDLSELLENRSDSKTRVVRSTTGDHDQSSASSNGSEPGSKTTKLDGLSLEVDSTSHCVDDRLGLLEDLLLHEVVELTLHDLVELHLKSLDRSSSGGVLVSSDSVDVQLTIVDVGNIVVLKEEDLLGVLDNGSRVGGEEELRGHGDTIVREESSRLRVSEGIGAGDTELEVGGSLGLDSHVGELNVDKVNLELLLGLDTNEERRTLSGGDNLVGEVCRLDQKTVGTLELNNNELGELAEVKVLVLVLVVDEFGKLGDALGIGVRLKLDALGAQKSLELSVVGNDTVVNDSELVVGVRSLGMAVLSLGLTVGSPSGVSNTGVDVERLLGVGVGGLDKLSKLGDLANLTVDVDGAIGVSVNGKTSRVVASVLLSLETLDEGVEDLSSSLRHEIVDVSKDSTGLVKRWQEGTSIRGSRQWPWMGQC